MTKRQWRREATKDESGIGNGRQIKYMAQMQEMMFKNQPKSYPLLEALFKRAGMTYTLSAKQQETLKRMLEATAAKEAAKQEVESADEVK